MDDAVELVPKLPLAEPLAVADDEIEPSPWVRISLLPVEVSVDEVAATLLPIAALPVVSVVAPP